MPRYLTKAKFKLAYECPTKLYYLDRPDEYANKQADDSFLKALAEGGVQVGALARCYYPDGILIDEVAHQPALALTNKHLQKDAVTLFEAAINYQHYFIRTDILIKSGNHLKLIEVKAKSINKEKEQKIVTKTNTINSKWKPYIADVAFQEYVLQQVFPNYRISSYLLLLDQDVTCPTDGLNQKFLLKKDKNERPQVIISDTLSDADLKPPILREVNVDSYTELIWNEQNERGISFFEVFQEFSKAYLADRKYTPIAKKECKKCEFKTTSDEEMQGLNSGFKCCWKKALNFTDKDFTGTTILDIWNANINAYLADGIVKIEQIDTNSLSDHDDGKPGLSQKQRQALQISKAVHQDDEVWIDTDNLTDEIKSWVYPLHFIDFETAMLPIPFNKGAHPYQGIAFQFSHHTLDSNGLVSHKGEYLNTTPGLDPTFNFIRALKKELEQDNGTIFCYSSHENTYLSYIYDSLKTTSQEIEDKEELCSFIETIAKIKEYKKMVPQREMVDLWNLVKRYYYDPRTNGSNSIKHVFPAIIQRSKYLQDKYTQPIYGSKSGIQSHNFKDHQWITKNAGIIQDPYTLLDPINKELPNDDIDLLFDSDQLKEGGAATIAYAKMQFTEMSDFERNELRQALLRYCELDTLAMVMIVEAWLDILICSSSD